MFGVDRSGNTVVVDRRLESSESTLDSTLTVSVPEEVLGALIEHTVNNVGDDTVELNTPVGFIGTDIGLGEAELTSPGGAYRFSVGGGGSVPYEEIGQFAAFELTQSRSWVTSFDDGRAITYGLDGPASASNPNLAMVNKSVDAIRLFGTAVTLEPGESATWRTAAVAHNGGPEAPATGGNLVDAAFEASPDPESAEILYSSSEVGVDEEISFTVSGLAGADESLVEWEFGDGSTASGGTVTHSYAEPGEYTVTATHPEVSISETTVSVLDGPAVLVDPAFPTVSETIEFAPVGFEETPVWDMGDGTVIDPSGGPGRVGGDGVVYDYENSGEYTVTAETGNERVTKELTVVDGVNIKTVQVSPENLVLDIDTDISFLIGVDTPTGDDVEAVTVEYGEDSNISAEPLEAVADEVVKDIVTEFDLVDLPDSAPVGELLGLILEVLGVENAYLATASSSELLLTTGDNTFSIEAETADSSAQESVSVTLYTQGGRLDNLETASEGASPILLERELLRI